MTGGKSHHIWQNLFKVTGMILLLGLLLCEVSTQVSAAPPAGKIRQKYNPTPADLINAVNNLRLSHGLPTLNTHPALMQAAQWEADAIAAGATGHTRPPGLTLGQWLITLGYPLSGNIALDGYRSENWVAGSELTVAEAIQLWLGDAPHTDTMLSTHRSDIGAGVAVGEDEWGKPVFYYVIETALQTSSGQQQPEALALLTSLPETQIAAYGDATQAAAALLMPQYIVPVTVATARPDGDVIHEVKYGQSLWGIAIAYGVRIAQIQQLNNLASTEVWPDQQLLIQKGATQPAPTLSQTPTRTATATPSHPTRTLTPAPLLTVASSADESGPGINPTLVMFLLVAALVGGSIAWLVLRDIKR
jgi:LysM repeat protein